jgi:formate dehydrogenase maturation protein FdhE
MKCPNCGGETAVRKTEPAKGNLTLRLRRCAACGLNFNTVEPFRDCPECGDKMKTALVVNAVPDQTMRVKFCESCHLAKTTLEI